MPARPSTVRVKFFNHTLPLRVVLTGSVALQVLAVTALAGYVAFREGQTAIYDLTVQLRNQASTSLHNRLAPYFATPHQVNQLKANAIRLDQLNADNFDQLRPYLLFQLQTFDSITNTGIATEAGDYISVGRQIDGEFSNPVIDRAQKKIFRYGLDQAGDRTEILQSLPYRDPRADSWYRLALTQGKATWSPIFTWTFKEFGIGLMAAQPVYDETGTLVGVVNCGLVLNHISDFLRDLEIAKLGKVFIVDQSGLLVATSTGESLIHDTASPVAVDQPATHRVAATDSSDPLIRLVAQHLVEQFGDFSHIRTPRQLDFTLAHERQFVQLTPIVDERGIDWLAVIVVPESAFADQIDAHTQNLIGLCLAALLLSAGLGWLTARWLAIPIQRLSKASEILARGNLDYQVETRHSATEINTLAQSFNQMAQQLRASFDALRISEASFRNMAANVPGAIFRYVLHADGSDAVLYMSPGCYELWEIDAEVAKQSAHILWEVIHPEDLPAVQASVAKSAQMLQPWHAEWRIITPAGRVKWLQGAGNPTQQKNGDVIWDTVILDVSQRNRAEQALRESDEKFRQLAEAIQEVFWLADVDIHQMLYVSPGYERTWGRSCESLYAQPKSFIDGIHPDDRQRVIEVLATHTSIPFEQEYRVVQPDGTIRWVRDRGFPIYDASGTVIRRAGVAQDITERRHAQDALQQSERRLATLISNLPGYVYRVHNDPNYTPEFISEGVLAISGYHPQEYLVDRTISCGQEIHPDDRDLVWTTIQHAVALHQPYECEFRIITKSGQQKWVWERGQGIFDDQGNLLYLEGFVTDISDRKLAAIRLQQTAEHERLVRLLTERIRQSLDLADILTTTVTEVRQILQADRVILFKLNPDGSGYVVQESVEVPWPAILGQTLSDPCFHAEYIQHYVQGRVQATADIEDGSLQACHVDFLRQLGVRANLVVPILHTDTLWGLLIVHHCAQPRPWSDAEIQLLKQLADQVAIALQQSELYQQLQHLNISLEHQVHQRTQALRQALEFESLLQRIADKIREILDEQQVIQTAVDELMHVLHLNGCGIGLFDLDQETSTLCYSQIDADTPTIHETVVHFSTHPELYYPLLQGEQLQFCGIVNYKHITQSEPAHGTILISPLIDTCGALGELWLYKSGDAAFDTAEIRLIQQVASQCTIGIRQSRLYQTSQVQVQELEQLHQMKDDFLSTVSHELRSPMTNIKMAIQMMELKLEQEHIHDERLTHYLQILDDACTQELTLINDLLDLQRLEAGVQSLELEHIDLNYWLPSIAELFEARAHEQQQQFSIQLPLNLPTLITDLNSFKRIVMELLHNACKYTPPNEHITIEAEVTDTTLLIHVSNTGVELPAEELPRLFEKFYRVPGGDRRHQGGTGLGLALVKRLMECLNGSVEVESANHLTRFTIQFPLNASAPHKVLNESMA